MYDVRKNIGTRLNVEVKWCGKYTLVPQLPPPVLMNVCRHHAYLHPKCKVCKTMMTEIPMFPPIKFYQAAFVQNKHKTKTDASDSDVFDFNFKNKEHCVVVEEKNNSMGKGSERIGQIEALCEDQFGRCYMGVLFYFSRDEIRILLNKHNLNLPNPSTFVYDSEVVIDSKLSWVKISDVKRRCYVFTRPQKKEMELGTAVDPNIKLNYFYFCEGKR